jgi:hypothetical protein
VVDRKRVGAHINAGDADDPIIRASFAAGAWVRNWHTFSVRGAATILSALWYFCRSSVAPGRLIIDPKAVIAAHFKNRRE